MYTLPLHPLALPLGGMLILGASEIHRKFSESATSLSRFKCVLISLILGIPYQAHQTVKFFGRLLVRFLDQLLILLGEHPRYTANACVLLVLIGTPLTTTNPLMRAFFFDSLAVLGAFIGLAILTDVVLRKRYPKA